MEGILVINKPRGFTSHDVVEIVRTKLRIKKVGHAGTLDPQATGVLILLLGKATKSAAQFLNLEKEYLAEVIFGITTDTYDAEGLIADIRNFSFSFEEIKNILPSFMGTIEQIPPQFSALHWQGKRLYELARQNLDVEIKPRLVNISKLEICEFKQGKFPSLTLKVVCSKGTYIRSLAHDLGKKLGCGGFLRSLVRTRVGEYSLEQAKNLEKIVNSEW